MKLTILLIATALFAAEQPPKPKDAVLEVQLPKAKEFPMDETVALRVENASLRINLIKSQAEDAISKLQAQQEQERAKICAKVGIVLSRCKLDLDNRKIVENPATAAVDESSGGSTAATPAPKK